MVVSALTPVFVMVVSAFAPVFVLNGNYCLGPCVCTQWLLLPWPLCLYGSYCLGPCVCMVVSALTTVFVMIVTALVPVFVW